jgi:transposase
MTDQERITDLEGQLSQALARISELEAPFLRRVGSKNSQNSHTPPSDDLSRKDRSLRERSGKLQGGQSGHKGHTLKRSDTPDKVVELVRSYCHACGTSLEGSTFALQSRRQVLDIPPIIPEIREYQCFGTTCSCHKVVGELVIRTYHRPSFALILRQCFS